MPVATKTPVPVVDQAEPTAISHTVALEKMLCKLTGEQRTIIARIQTGATLHRDPRPGYLRENGIDYNEWPMTQAGQPCRSARVAAIEPMVAAGLLTSADTLIWTINPTIVAALARSTEASTLAPVDGESVTMTVSAVVEPIESLEEAKAITEAEPTVAAKTAKIGKLINNAVKVRKAAKR